MQREIELVKELLAEEPDSKCMYSSYHFIGGFTDSGVKLGCMEAIVNYTLVLQSMGVLHAEDAKITMLPLLDRLATIDPMRKARYQDIVNEISEISM